MTGSALAYIGPGAGISAIGTVLALIGGLFLLIVGFVWYPIKRIIRGRRSQQAAAPSTQKDA
ncbi:MAG: hypothetical protein AAGL49_03505 [Pseudomonadota bacterium]